MYLIRVRVYESKQADIQKLTIINRKMRKIRNNNNNKY